MARRTTKGRRRGRPTASGSNGSAATLLSHVTELVAQNQSLVRENKALHSILARVSQAVEAMPARPAAGAPAAGAGRKARTIRRRRRITDPASLERRRAALAKARAVLAERRASKKSE